MDWSTADRDRFLGQLDSVERVLVTVYRVVLALIMAAIIGVVILVVIHRPWGDGNQGEWFYFTVAVLVGLACAGGKFISLGHRQRRAEIPATFSSRNENGGRTWELKIGSPLPTATDGAEGSDDRTQFHFSRQVNVPFAAISHDVLPDDAAVRRIAAEMETGVELDAACRAVQPEYETWNVAARWAYRHYVTGLLEQVNR